MSTASTAATATSAADAAAIGAEEFLLLPPDAVQVPCSPAQATYPPFLRLSGLSTGNGWILTDGRCFTDPTASPSALNIPLLISAP